MLASQSGSQLVLNLGQSASNRGSAYPAQNENYTLTSDGNNGSTDNISVTAEVNGSSYTQEYYNVGSIWVYNTQGNNDTISINNNINVPVTMTLGSGNNTISTGSGPAAITIQGNGNNSVTSYGTLNAIIQGGGANTITANSGSATVSIQGSGNNSITAESLNATVTGDGANGITANDGDATVSIQGNGDNTVSASEGNATVTIEGDGNNDVSSKDETNVTITGTGNNTITTGDAYSTITDEGSGANTIDEGTGGGVYIGGLNVVGSPFSSKGATSLVDEHSTDNFSVQLSGYSTYSVSNSSISYGSFSLTIGGVDAVTLTTPTSTLSAGNTITLSGWTGSTQINTSGNNNSLSVNPGTTSSAVTYTLTNSSLTTTFGQTISYSDIQTANLTGGSGTNSYYISSWSGNGSINGSSSNNNTIYATNNTNFTLTNTGFSRFNIGSFTLSNIQNAVLTGGSSADTFTVSNWSGNVTLNGVSGKNIFNLVLSGSTNGIYNVSDSASVSSDVLNITASRNVTVGNAVINVGTQTVNYSKITTLSINGAASALTYNIQAFYAATTTVVTTYGVNNVINVGSSATSSMSVTSTIAGPLTVKGNGRDTLNVEDKDDDTARTDTLTATTLMGLGMGTSGITYSGLSNLNIYLGASGNTFTVVATAPGKPIT